MRPEEIVAFLAKPVTPKMIDAGWKAVDDWDLEIAWPEKFFTAVFQAMALAAPSDDEK